MTATDAPSNPPAEALTAQKVSAPFTIDNTPPKITGLTAARSGGKLQVRWHAADALNNSRGGVLARRRRLDGGGAGDQLSDSPALDYDLSLDAAAGEHTIAVRVVDDNDNQTVDKVVVK